MFKDNHSGIQNTLFIYVILRKFYRTSELKIDLVYKTIDLYAESELDPTKLPKSPHACIYIKWGAGGGGGFRRN